MVHKQSISVGLVALSSMAAAVNGFVQPQGTSLTTPISSSTSMSSPLTRSHPLHMSIADDSSNFASFDWNDKSSSQKSSEADTANHPNLDSSAALDLPVNNDVPEVRQLRWEREALLQSKFASGDELYELRQRSLELNAELKDIRKQKSSSSADMSDRLHDIESQLVNLNGRDAEFMYSVSSDLLEKAMAESDDFSTNKYKVQMEEARLCIPQLNMHGLWVGKYGDHGYEMIRVTYEGNVLVATKVTGDNNVPKGKVTFTVDLTPTISSSSNGQPSYLEPIELDAKAQKQWGKKYLPRHVGRGQVASEGFRNAQWMEGQMILVGRFFSFAWVPLGHQIFFGRPSNELTLKMLQEAKDEDMKKDPVTIMKDMASNMMEETYWTEIEDRSVFDEEGAFQ